MPSTGDAAVGLSAPPLLTMWACLVLATPLATAYTPPYNVDYDLGGGEYEPPSLAAYPYLPPNPAAPLPPPSVPFPFQNRRQWETEEEADVDDLPGRLDMRLNRVVEGTAGGGLGGLQLPAFGLRRPDLFDLQPQLGFGMADFRMGAGGAPANTRRQTDLAAEEPKSNNGGVGGPAAPLGGPFPQLTLKQRQFAVSPEMPEFFQDEPDFLGFRLQEAELGGNGAVGPAASAVGPAASAVGPAASAVAFQPEARAAGAQQSPEQAQETHMHQGEEEEEEEDDLSEAKRARMGVAAPLMWDQYVEENKEDDFFFTAVVAASTALTVFGVVGAGFCYHRSLRKRKDSEEVEYPAYGITGPAKDASPAGDRKLAQSAQMYHYQHQKNQMIAVGRSAGGGQQSEGEESEGEGEEGEGEGEGDYTVYECPGLASTDEMEVKNPLFADDPTPKP